MDRKLNLGPADIQRWSSHFEYWYKFRIVANYLARKGVPVKACVDVGVNLGVCTILMARYFPRAAVVGFEAVEKYAEIARGNLLRSGCFMGTVYTKAITAQHLYEDDLCEKPRAEPLKTLTLLFATGAEGGGDGWIGGSMVMGEEEPQYDPRWYDKLTKVDLHPVTFSSVVDGLAKECGEVGYAKFDCEGCEYTSLAETPTETMAKVRYLGGEYHDSTRFIPVMRKALLPTHRVWLSGNKVCGAFFAERRDEPNGILLDQKSELKVRHGIRKSEKDKLIFPEAVDWNLFDPELVPEDIRTIFDRGA